MNHRIPLTLQQSYDSYVKINREIHVPAIADLWGCSPKELVSCICNDSVGGRFVDGLWIRGYDSNQKWVYEVCDTPYVRGNILLDTYYDSYITHNIKHDQHISVFKHDENWIKEIRERGKVSSAKGCVTADFIIIELDRKVESSPIHKAYTDTIDILRGIESFSHYSFSGNNSVHIRVDSGLFGNPIGDASDVTGRGNLFYNLAHWLAKDVRYKNGIVDSWFTDWDIIENEYLLQFGELPKEASQARQDLENIDPNIYGVNSLIRQPYSIHPKTGKLSAPIINVVDGDVVYGDTITKKAPPLFLDVTFELYEKKEKFKRKQTTYPNELVYSILKLIIPDIEDYEPNSDGWIQDLYNPFYEDTNPSLAISLTDGRFYDFGNPDYQFDFVTLVSKVYNISRNQAYFLIQTNLI